MSEHNKTVVSADRIAAMIDHTILKPEATYRDIEKLCGEASKYRFCSVCINPSYVSTAAELLRGTDVKVCTVIGFPLGATSTASKVFEAKKAIEDGAEELDMVVHVGMVKAGEWEYVKRDIQSVKDAIYSEGSHYILKVIFETCLLTDDEICRLCEICTEIGVHYVKTSTGFSTGGAKAEHVRLMRKSVGKEVKVKASGGIRYYEDALSMIEAGADRLGVSAGVAIISEAEKREKELKI